MKEIEVEITGTTPLLMNSPKGMIDKMTKTSRKTTQRYDPKEEAEKVAYRKKNKELYIPSEAIKGAILGASSYRKFGKFTAKPMIAGGVMISPSEIGLGTKDYEIDLRTVVIQRARVVKARPTLPKWKVKFTITYNEILIKSSDDLKEILQDAGQRVGILDFRPAKSGNFGMFEVTQWEEK